MFAWFVISVAGALFAEAATVTIETRSFGIDYLTTTKQGFIIPGMFTGLFGYEPILPWEFKKVRDTIYDVRIPTEKDVFLRLDAGAKKVFIVSDGTFGAEGGTESIISGAVFVEYPPPLKPQPERLQVRLPNPVLTINTKTNEVAISAAGLRLMGPDDIEVVKAEEGRYHVRGRGMKQAKTTSPTSPTFLVINIDARSVSNASGTFGERVAGTIPVNTKVSVSGEGTTTAEPDVHKDMGFVELRKDMVRESAWIESQQERYLEMLGRQKADVLVVPVQVQDYAFDHVERSLMTKYLVHLIRSTTKLRVADPDVVELALGWGYRTFSRQRIYSAANAAGARKVISLYAGHNRDMKMRITAVIQERRKDAAFDTGAKTNNTVFKDLAFSDEKLPSEALLAILPRLLDSLEINLTQSSDSFDKGELRDVPVPAAPMDLVRQREKSPLKRAAYLALLGTMSPSETRTSERFLTRSLMLLRDVAPSSPDCVFLKAYAFSLLFRRPAALELLREPTTPEQRALRYYLDGDLLSLTGQIEKIQNPVPKVLMQNALNDLRWHYDYQTAGKLSAETPLAMPKGWSLFNTSRYNAFDSWYVPKAIEFKKYLDNNFPIKGLSFEDVALNTAMRGDSNIGDTTRMDMAVPEHCRRLMKERPELLADDSLGQVVPLDIIDLIEAWINWSMLRSVSITVRNQGLYDEGAAKADRYEAYYKGYPELAVIKSMALSGMAKNKSGEERTNIGKTISELDNAACFWFQGQTLASNYVCSSLNYYDNDFPKRPYWHRNFDPAFKYGDRIEYELRETAETKQTPTAVLPAEQNFFMKEARSELRDYDLSLRYSISDFTRLDSYYTKLLDSNMKPEADTLIERNKHRFVGAPSRPKFFAKLAELSDDDEEIPRLYEETIAISSGAWEPYYGLGTYYLEHGDVQKAQKTYQRYPLFRTRDADSKKGAENTVGLSNNAYSGGLMLHWTGAVESAKELFDLSAGYQTGSARGMWSEYYLALHDGNYPRAAQTALALGQRYSDTSAYYYYMSILCVLGKCQESDRLFFSMDMFNARFIYWNSIVTARRMAGNSDDEVREWLAKNSNGKISRGQAQLYYFQAFFIDRKPDPDLATMIENIEKHATIKENDRRHSRIKDHLGRDIIPTPVLFADIWYLVHRQKFAKVYEQLEPWWSRVKDAKAREMKHDERVLLPYLAWSGARSGKKTEINGILGSYWRKFGRNFEFWLATAMSQAAAGRHDDAFKSLDLARTNINSRWIDPWPIEAWYQVVDACELLFEDTKMQYYRDRALEYAKMYQLVQPLEPWAYAVEAKLAKTEDERLRPLALALYLDQNSFHISKISKKEKKRALEWLEKNNPFLRSLQGTNEARSAIMGSNLYR